MCKNKVGGKMILLWCSLDDTVITFYGTSINKQTNKIKRIGRRKNEVLATLFYCEEQKLTIYLQYFLSTIFLYCHVAQLHAKCI